MVKKEPVEQPSSVSEARGGKREARDPRKVILFVLLPSRVSPLALTHSRHMLIAPTAYQHVNVNLVNCVKRGTVISLAPRKKLHLI